MNYPYAVGSVKVVEANILDRNKLAKLFKLNNEEFIKTLIDLGYGNTNSNNLEEIINSEILTTKTYLDSITPDKRHTDLFYFASDAINIKAMYKNKFFNVKQDIYVNFGVFDKELLTKAIYHEDYQGLSKSLIKLFKAINRQLEGITSPRELSAIIDKAIFNYIFKENSNQTLKVYFKAFVDFNNVVTFVRSRNLNWQVDKFLEMFIDGGEIDKNVFLSAFEVSKDTESFFKDYYQDKIAKGLKAYFEKEDLDVLERYFDKLILTIMQEYRHDSFGIGPIIYYFLEKQAEAKNIRMIYAQSDIEVYDLLEY